MRSRTKRLRADCSHSRGVVRVGDPTTTDGFDPVVANFRLVPSSMDRFALFRKGALGFVRNRLPNALFPCPANPTNGSGPGVEHRLTSAFHAFGLDMVRPFAAAVG